MIHLTGHNYKSREIVQNIFSPLVGVISSPQADDVCHKNNLSFVELLQPFAKIICEAHFRDVSGTSVSVRGLRLNFCDIDWRPPQTVLARKMLNESVTSAANDQTKFTKIGNVELELPTAEPWFENWREIFLTVQFPADHEFTRHFLSCLIVLSSNDPNIIETAHKLTQRVQQMQTITPQKLPKWFQPNEVLNSYVVLHEGSSGDLSRAQQGYELLKSTFGDSKCFLIQMNSLDGSVASEIKDHWATYIKRQPKPDMQSTELSAPKTPQDGVSIISMPAMQVSMLAEAAGSTEIDASVMHPLSPLQESATEAINSKFSISSESIASQTINPNVWASDMDADAPHGSCLNAMDVENIRHFVQDYAIRALIPYVEHLVGILSEAVTNKKGVSKSLLSATKRWFVTRTPGVGANNQNAVIYTYESAELQTRKLGDLYFMFRHYNLAFQAYHQAKRDFNADSAWQYYAGALEMAALSAFMLGTAHRKTYDYMEDAIVCYLTVCKLQQFATRATLLSIECLKTARLYGEAAKQLIRMTSEDSVLRSALLLEQAAYCFLAIQPPMHRKYAFNIVLAGHRYSRAGQRKHAFRCYRQAYQVFQERNWSLAEDHIQYTMAKQAYMLKKLDDASQSFAHLLRPESLQNTQQQASFLKEYIQTQNELLKRNPELGLLPHALPKVMQESIRVLTLSQSTTTPSAQYTPASQIDIKSDMLDEPIWQRIEEMLVTTAAANKPLIFKPTRNLFTKQYPALENPLVVQGESIELAVTLTNPITCSITLNNIDLLWKLTLENDEVLSNECLHEPLSETSNKIAVNAAIKSVSTKTITLEDHATETIYFKLTPKLTGHLNIVGLVYQVASTAEPNASLLGSLQFETLRIKTIGKQSNQLLYDNKLSLKIVPTVPALCVNFSPVPTTLLAGEVLPVTITLRNLGIVPIDDIYLGCESPRWITLQDRDTDIPLSILNSLKDLSNEKLVKDKETRRQHIFRLLPKSNNNDKTNEEPALKAQSGTTVSMWLQAPYELGEFTLRLLFYYALPAGAASQHIKYRLVRHCWRFNILDCLRCEATCVVSNSLTQELGINVNLRNDYDVRLATTIQVPPSQTPTTAEVFINQLALYSIESRLNTKTLYVLNPMVISDFQPGGNCLKPQTSSSLQCRLQSSNSSTTNSISTYSSTTITTSSPTSTYTAAPFKLEEILAERLSTMDIASTRADGKEHNNVLPLTASHSFLINHETIFFSPTITSEDFNSIIATKDPHMTLALGWSALIVNNAVEQRWVQGQHFVQLRYLYYAGSCPPPINAPALPTNNRSTNNSTKAQVLRNICEAAIMNRDESNEQLAIDNEDDSADYWENGTAVDDSISQRCLLEDETFVLTVKA